MFGEQKKCGRSTRTRGTLKNQKSFWGGNNTCDGRPQCWPDNKPQPCLPIINNFRNFPYFLIFAIFAIF